jgi:hypothetical protein
MPTPKNAATSLPYRVRRSPIHGTGVFATRAIPKGTRIVEYLGERVSHAEADRRYENKDVNDNHTFLFTVNSRIVIDAGVGGNEARWINHSCDPNCETVIENKRVFIEAARDIGPGEELAYDYMISREPNDPENIEEIFACRCGSANCRGTMLLPPEKKKRRKARAASKHADARARGGAAGKGRVRPKAAKGGAATSARGRAQGAKAAKRRARARG